MENICKTVAQISNEYECNRSNLKKQYLLLNILLYNKIIQEIRHTIKGNVASFGTGYPFYALDRNFEWDLPVIKEQIHYNNELLEAAKNSQAKEWVCAQCLYQNSKFMPDLKQICKPCPNIEDELKPRKVINRLPDLDMWTVCDRNDIPIIKEYLQELFLKYGFFPSDINPLNSFEDIKKINYSLRKNLMPTKLLPLDAHIIDYETLYNLIAQTPYTIMQSLKAQSIPYLPIHPLSLRKTWQYDDTAYNFIHDYLSSFTEFNFTPEMQKMLQLTREIIAYDYTFEELYDILLMTGPDSVRRRHETPQLKRAFKERINSWKK